LEKSCNRCLQAHHPLVTVISPQYLPPGQTTLTNNPKSSIKTRPCRHPIIDNPIAHTRYNPHPILAKHNVKNPRRFDPPIEYLAGI
jgi:hypothetical protein